MTDEKARPGWIAESLSVRGRVALVAGASGGIGRALAVALADAGANVAGLGRNKLRLMQTVKEIESFGVRGIALVADVTNAAAVSSAVSSCRSQLGEVDILVNCAGNMLLRPLVPLPGYNPGLPGFDTPTSDAEWNGVFAVHVNSAFHLMRETVPSMLERRWGRIINVTSVSIARSTRFGTAYESAKGALAVMTRSLAKEWARYGVTVNSIAPGQFRTEMTKEMHDNPKGLEWMLDRIPMKRAGRLEELGPIAVFLASEASSYLTGQIIFVDGGESL